MTKDLKQLIRACAVSKRVIEPAEYNPLTHMFVKASYDQAYGEGAFDERFMVSHGAMCEKGSFERCWVRRIPICQYGNPEKQNKPSLEANLWQTPQYTY